MLSEWNAECAHDDPVLVVPWSDPATAAQFIDLRTHPYDIAEIVEAEHHPALGRALRSLNASRSPFLTAKCDAWTLTAAPTQDAEAGEDAEATDQQATLQQLQIALLLQPEDALFGFASYIDLLWRERSVFASAHQQQDRLDRIVRRAQRLPHPHAALECVLRPAFLDLAAPLEGFATTLYISAVGHDSETAHRRWELALEDVTALLRSRDLEPAPASATIDTVSGPGHPAVDRATAD